MPNYDVRYRYTDQTGAVFAAKTVVNATDGDDAVTLARANIVRRLPLNVVEIIGVAPSTAFSDTQDDVGMVGATSTAALSIGGADALRAVAAASAVNFIEAVQGATGTPGRVQLRAAGSDTNISIALTPKGTGALLAQVPDSTTAGGNARGTNAVDWQTSRSAASQVASGTNAVIGGGTGNIANISNATVAGGSTNTASGTSSTVGGGSGNNAANFATTVAGGSTNTASGNGAWVPGGTNATTRSLAGVGAWSAGTLAANGDAQAEEHVLRRQTTDATATRLTADNAVAATTNTINLANFSTLGGVLTVVSKATGSTAAATWRVNVSAVRGNGVGTVVVYEGAGAAIVPTASNGTGSAWRLDVAADTTNGGVSVTVTGAAATTINWVARFSAAQVATAS